MKYLLLCFIILILSGCAFKETKPTNYYALEFKTPLPNYKKGQNTLLITKPILNAPYNSKTIFFTQKPYLFEYYVVSKWVEFPHLMIQNVLYETLQNSGIYKNIILKASENKDFTLNSHITKLLHTYKNNKSFATVHIKFELIKENRIIQTLDFKKEILCEDNSPYGFIKAANLAFEQIGLELLHTLENTI